MSSTTNHSAEIFRKNVRIFNKISPLVEKLIQDAFEASKRGFEEIEFEQHKFNDIVLDCRSTGSENESYLNVLIRLLEDEGFYTSRYKRESFLISWKDAVDGVARNCRANVVVYNQASTILDLAYDASFLGKREYCHMLHDAKDYNDLDLIIDIIKSTGCEVVHNEDKLTISWGE